MSSDIFSKKVSTWALIGLMILPIAHVVVSFWVIDVANEAIHQCTMDYEKPVGTALSENLGIFSGVGEAIEDYLNDSFSEEIKSHLGEVGDLKDKSVYLMYASFLLLLIDIACLWFRESVNKFVLNFARLAFTIAIGYLVYNGVLIVYSISSSRLDAKTYGLFGLLTGGDSFGYDILVGFMSAAMYVAPLLILHFLYYKSSSKYYDVEEDDDYSVELAPIVQTPVLAQQFHQPQLAPVVQGYLEQPNSTSSETTDEDLTRLDELLEAGILTPEEHAEQRGKIIPTAPQQTEQVENNKIALLRNLKSLLDADILTSEEYSSQKSNILRTSTIPMWSADKTNVETLIELKSLLDDNILTQEEFDFHKKRLMNSL